MTGSERYFGKTAVLLVLFLLSGIFSLGASELPAGEKEFLRGDYDGLLAETLKAAAENPQQAYLPLIIASELNKQYLSNAEQGREEVAALVGKDILPPLAHDLAVKMLAGYAGAQGRQFEATELRRKRGLVPLWRIAGPFGEYDNSSFYQHFEPESNIDFSIFMQGTGKDVTWRLLSENVCLNRFTPYKWIAPQRGVIYLYTQFRLEKAEQIIVEKEGSGSFHFWVDGYDAGGADVMEEESPRIQRFKSPEELTPGWHRLLVKIYAVDHEAEFGMRLLDSGLKPLAGVGYDLKEIRGANAFGSRKWDEAEPDLSGYSTVEKALYYQYQFMYDKAAVLWESAVREEPANAAYRIYYAMCVRQAVNIIPGPMRESIIQREAHKALQLDKEAVSALFMLAEYERRHKRYKEAGEYFAAALQVNPRAVMIHGGRIRMAMENDWSGEIAEWMGELARIYPESYLLQLLQGMLYNNRGYVDKAAAALAGALQQDQENIIVSSDVIKSYFAAGEVTKAVAVWENMPLYLQERTDLLVLYSEILARLQEDKKAVGALNNALGAVGSDDRINRIIGDVYYSNGDDRQAVEFYRRSLSLAEGNYYLRRLLDNLEGRDYRFWLKYMVNPFEKIDDFARSNKKYLGRTVKLIDQTVLTLYPDGAYANYTHELQTVLTDSGVSQATRIDSFGELLQARTIIPENGITLEPTILPGIRTITMPAVSAGAAIDHAYIFEKAESADLKLHFPKWYFRSPNTEESFVFSQYIIRVPVGVDFVYATRNLDDKVEFSSFEDEDGTREFIWTGQDMPEAIHEEGSPAIGSTLPFVEIASKQSWDDVYHTLLNNYLGRTIPYNAIKNKVHELTDGLQSADDKIDAIQRFVCREVLASTSRAPAGHVLLQRFGNRNLLALAMFKAAGIRAEPVAVRPPANILYEPVWRLPSAADFTDYFIRVFPEEDRPLWLDLRAKYSEAGQIGEDYAGGTGFALGSEKGEFVFLPVVSEESYMIRREREYRIDTADNYLNISGRITYPGTRGWEFKENMLQLSADKRAAVIEDILMESLFGVNLESLQFPELDKSGIPFKVEYIAGVSDRIRQKKDGAFGVNFALPQIKMLPQKNSNRRLTPYHLSNYLAAADKYTYIIPAGAVLKELPADVIIRSEFGLYSLVFSTSGSKVIVERKYLFKPQIIALDDWENYRELVQQINRVEAGYIWFTE